MKLSRILFALFVSIFVFALVFTSADILSGYLFPAADGAVLAEGHYSRDLVAQMIATSSMGAKISRVGDFAMGTVAGCMAALRVTRRDKMGVWIGAVPSITMIILEGFYGIVPLWMWTIEFVILGAVVVVSFRQRVGELR